MNPQNPIPNEKSAEKGVEYDLIVIGGGPAGIAGARAAAEAGKRVALVDSHPDLGGAGINTGTVPSKTLRETALAFSGLKSRNLHGVDLSLRREATVADFMRHEQHVRDGFREIVTARLRSHRADIHRGTASFLDARTVRVRPGPGGGGEEVVLRADRILIATGSSPSRPALFPFGSPEIYDSDTLLQLDRIPKTFAVVGAGVIGSEYACTFSALGSQVHLIDGHDVLLPFLDREISRELAAAMAAGGIEFHWNEKVARCVSEGGGPNGVVLTLASGKELKVDALLVAAGRQSNTGELALDAAGVRQGDRGLIAVSEHFQTNVPGIYAAGDVVGFPSLASVGMEQGLRAVRHALGIGKAARISPLLPYGIYTIPEAAMAGETEESLKKDGVDYVVGRALYRENGRGRIIGDLGGLVKLLFRRGDGGGGALRLAGVHIVGEQATELVHVGLVAMMAGGDIGLLLDACFNTPTLGLLYKVAAADAQRQAGI